MRIASRSGSRLPRRDLGRRRAPVRRVVLRRAGRDPDGRRRTSSGACASSAHLARAREAKRAKHEVHGALACRRGGARTAASGLRRRQRRRGRALAGPVRQRRARRGGGARASGGARDAALAALAAAQDGASRQRWRGFGGGSGVVEASRRARADAARPYAEDPIPRASTGAA
ncbi:hypothetical protein JL721_12512 [Aureococcus anophagefferens]|nr:hypothetical protein JL721_12512 [Aureococcus anophagefferens]